TSAGAAGIGSAWSGGGEETPGRRRCWLAETKRYVLELWRVGGREGADLSHSVRRHQRQVLAIRRELEIRVQPARRIKAIFSRGEDDQISAGVQRHGGKCPLGKVRCVVREMVTCQRDRGGVRILNLNPIGKLNVLVGQRGPIRSHELGDNRSAEAGHDG